MIHTAICDDHPAQILIMTALLEKYKRERLGTEIKTSFFSSGEELLKSIESGNVFNLLLLDIFMPGINGIELAEEIRKHNKKAVVIFLTVSENHAFDAFGVSANQYILKPIEERSLFPILDKAIEKLNYKEENYFFLSTSDGEIKIAISAIICIEFNCRRPRFHLENGIVLTGKCVRVSMTETLAPILDDKRFFIVHKSFVINIEQVEKLNKDSLYMKGNLVVPVSRNKYAEIKKVYSQRGVFNV